MRLSFLSLVLEPDPLHAEEEGSGHTPTLELSPGWKAGVTNQIQ